MGIDVNLYADGEISDEHMARAEPYLRARSQIAWVYPEEGGSVLHRSEWAPGRVEFYNSQRYYGPGYERGDWPAIYGAIRLMQAAFPGATVFYGGDSTDDGEECTEEFLSGMWAHFLGPHGDDYRERWKAWSVEVVRTPENEEINEEK